MELADYCLIIRNIYMHLKLFQMQTLEELKNKTKQKCISSQKLSFGFYLEI